MRMNLLRRFLLLPLFLVLASQTGFASITVNFFADAGTKRPHRADGQPLEDGQLVQVGTFVDTFDPYAANVTLVDILANWRLFGQAVTETNEIAPAGSFYGSATREADGFAEQPAYLLFIRKSTSKPLGALADDVLEFGLFTKQDFTNGDIWLFPRDGELFPFEMNANDANFTTGNLGSLDVDKLVLRTYDASAVQQRIFGDFARYEGDWIFSVRFGFLWESATYPWIYHLDLGWLYHFGPDGENLWTWSPDRGFLWISWHPIIFSIETGEFFDIQAP